MRFKKGVQVQDEFYCITKPCIEAMFKAVILYHQQNITGIRATITSVLDGTHRADSKHYEGNAFDLRTWNEEADGQMPHAQKQVIAHLLQSELGLDYDVVVENTHIHVEYDPKE